MQRGDTDVPLLGVLSTQPNGEIGPTRSDFSNVCVSPIPEVSSA